MVFCQSDTARLKLQLLLQLRFLDLGGNRLSGTLPSWSDLQASYAATPLKLPTK